MGFRFRRSIRIVPGVRLNVSSSGVSTSVGRRGAWLTFGRRGTRETVGLPGSDLSFTTQSKRGSSVGVLLVLVLLILADVLLFA